MTLPETATDGRVFAALDVETTGLVPAASRIIEVAVIQFTSKGVRRTLHSLVNPGLPIPDQVTEITGITNEMVVNQPSLEKLWDSLLEIWNESILVAHNAPFDLGFLAYEGKRLGKSLPQSPTLDSLPLSRRLFPEVGKYKLPFLARALEIPLGKSHRATDDADLCRQIFEKALKRVAVERPDLNEEKLLEPLFSYQGGPLHCGDYLHDNLSLSEELNPLLIKMEEGKSIFIRYKESQKFRHVVPVYFHKGNGKEPLLRAYCLEEKKYKDYFAQKVHPVLDEESMKKTIQWNGQFKITGN